MTRLIFATHNKHKLEELRQIVGPDYEILGLGDIGWTEEIEETAPTLEGNAMLKARAVADRHPATACFSDDTGLEVEALGGEPGVRSARYAGEQCDSRANVDLLLERLQGCDNRRAAFRTAIVLVEPDGTVRQFEGRVDGEITCERHGEAGFGYDPVFRPEGWSKTFAEATPDEKNAVSHRGRAVAALLEYLHAGNLSD